MIKIDRTCILFYHSHFRKIESKSTKIYFPIQNSQQINFTIHSSPKYIFPFRIHNRLILLFTVHQKIFSHSQFTRNHFSHSQFTKKTFPIHSSQELFNNSPKYIFQFTVNKKIDTSKCIFLSRNFHTMHRYTMHNGPRFPI